MTEPDQDDVAQGDLPSGVYEVDPTLRQTRSGKIVGTSARLAQVLGVLDQVAASTCTVLVTGESGTGKETAVAALHEASPRANGPLVTVNCGAIPEALLESELFGHARGAFTGAHAARQGRVAAAEGGTLFLDEIGELPKAMQVKLLRLLQQREYSPVGDTRTYRCDVRVVVATNRDLEVEVREGRFREDLYYRLDVIHVSLPPLRERREDIPVLALHFLREAARRCGRAELSGFTDEAMHVIVAHGWPGNVRELENVVERSVLLAAGSVVSLTDLPARLRSQNGDRSLHDAPAMPDNGIDLRRAVDAFESGLIRQALERTGGNKNRAAQLLGINRTTLVEMVKRKRLQVA